MIVAAVIDDGRPLYLQETVASLDHVQPIDARVLIDDSGDVEYQRYLEHTYPDFTAQVHHETRRGLGGAVKSAWETALAHGADFVWHQEDDQVILADIDLTAFTALLEAQPQLAQVAIKRTPYNPQEHAAGGVVDAFPHLYTERSADGMTWTEFTHLFVFCPSLIPRRVIECALAHADNFLENGVTDALWAHGYRSCFWGAMFDPPLCDHVGVERSDGYKW